MEALVNFRELGMVAEGGYDVREVFDNEPIGHFTMDSTLHCNVNPTGVYMFTAKTTADINPETLRLQNKALEHMDVIKDANSMESLFNKY